MLPGAGDPLVLADGTKIDPASGEVIRDRPARFVAIPSNRQAVETVTRARRQLTELPAVPKQMNLLAAVYVYTTFGLSVEDIAIATGLNVEQIERVRSLDEYKTVAAEMTKAVVVSDVDDVRTVLARNAKAAAERMLELADSENEGVAVKAAADILDRAGLRPADVVQHNVTMQGGLAIEIVEKKSSDMPTIEMETP